MQGNSRNKNLNLGKRSAKVNREVSILILFFVYLSLEVSTTFCLVKEGNDFCRMEECEDTFQGFKCYLASPLILTKLEPKQELVVYLSVGDIILGVALVLEGPDGQKPIYFMSMGGPELRY